MTTSLTARMPSRLRLGARGWAFRIGVAFAAGAMITAAPAEAQIAAALGKPLPSPDLPIGTVSVRIVAGTGAAPVMGTDVTLLVNGVARVARTDSAGRAVFAGLPVGATVIAKVVDEDKAEHASIEFPVPSEGGARVMITTKPWQGGAGGPAAGGGGAGMPNPRQMSGEARPDEADPPGTLTVRVSYDDFKDSPEGVAVALVGYAYDDSVAYQLVVTDKAGRAQFTDLDRSGGTAYYAMTTLPRNGSVDRLISGHTEPTGPQGLRMILSGEKRDSTAPPVDDFGQGDQQVPTPAGKVRVVLEGLADLSAKVTLIDAATKKVIGEASPETAAPDPSRVQASSQFEQDAKMPAGTLDVMIVGGAGQASEPLKDIEVRVMPADAKDPSRGSENEGLASLTSADGTVRMAMPAKGPHKAMFTINGRPFMSRPFDLSEAGGRVVVSASWEEVGRPQAVISAPSTTGLTVYAECVMSGERYRSMPFQLLEHTGSKISVYVYPRALFTFQLNSFVEDELLAAQGRFEISNYSWAPYRPDRAGLLIPLPKDFRGGVVFGNDQNEVSVIPGEGFRIVRAIPPGGRKFHGGFSLPVAGGTAHWSLDLPMGAFSSSINVRQVPGMKVQAPAPGDVRTSDNGGEFYVIPTINIRKGNSMQMTVTGLPSPPAWRWWITRVIGVLVVAVMLAGVAIAVLRRRPEQVASADDEVRRHKLLDELVELERSGGNPKRREQVLRELEQLWT